MEKNQIKTILCQRLSAANKPFQRQGDQLSTPHATIKFQHQALILSRPGKAERTLPYLKVRISQLLLQL